MATGALHVFGLEIPHAIATLDGFRPWVSALGDAAPRVSFHRGTVHVEMTPQDFTSHEPVSTTINAALVIRALDLGRYFTPPSWFTAIEAGLSTEPDGFFATWESFRSGRLRVNPGRPTELLGRPDMALEVVSATSEKKDLRDLVEGYAQAGVPEYWIVDARGCRSDGRPRGLPHLRCLRCVVSSGAHQRPVRAPGVPPGHPLRRPR
jgi:Uma2 family endonuclease